MFEVSNLALEEGETEKKEWGHKLTGREKERKRDVVLMIILRSISAEESKNVEIDTTILSLACIYKISAYVRLQCFIKASLHPMIAETIIIYGLSFEIILNSISHKLR